MVFALLSVLLAGTALHPAAANSGTVSLPVAPAAVRLARVSQRISLPLALGGAVLSLALAVSLTVRAPRAAEPATAAATQRAEMGALTRLAQSSTRQGEQLAQERDERARAQADALLHQQRLNRSLEEQIQLGRDLHDGIIQSLYATGLQIESARALAPASPADADQRLAQCLQQLNRNIRDIRSYIAGLAPENVRHASFRDAVQALVTELGTGRDAQFDLRVDDSAIAGLSLATSTETLQIAREAISNALRHGGATHVTVRLHPGDGAICLLVQDDGRGFETRSATHGHGLGNMRARAERIGGTLRIESAPRSGTRVIVTLPVAPTA